MLIVYVIEKLQIKVEFLDLRIYEEFLNVFLYEYRGNGNFFDVELFSVICRVVGL